MKRPRVRVKWLFCTFALCLLGCSRNAARLEREHVRDATSEALRTELHVGDSTMQIEAVLKRHGIRFTYDQINKRYQCAFEQRSAVASEEINLMIYVFVDDRMRFVREEALIDRSAF